VKKLQLATLASCIGLSGCGAGDAALPELGEHLAAISGGARDLQRTGVLSVLTVTPETIDLCTGSLIAPNLVLTARHCVAATSADEADCGDDSAYFAAPHPANELWVGSSGALGGPLSSFGFLAFRPVEGFFGVREVYVPDVDSVCNGDVALLILDEPIADEAVALLEPRLDQPVVSGEPYTAVGFGGTPVIDEQGVRRARSGLSVQCSPIDCAGGTAVGADEFSGDQGVCSGDSGGPALAADGGEVIGVASRTNDDCSNSVYSATWAFRDLIRSVGERAVELGEFAAPEWLTARPFVAPDAGVAPTPVEPFPSQPPGAPPPLAEPDAAASPDASSDGASPASPPRPSSGCTLGASPVGVAPWTALVAALWAARRARRGLSKSGVALEASGRRSA
jgi:hypothetical protein